MQLYVKCFSPYLDIVIKIYYFASQVNIKSLEDVVRAYLKLAEEKTETAKEESQQMVLDIEDLDNIQTPERYMTIWNSLEF